MRFFPLRMSPVLLSPALLIALLPGCHLFVSGEIEKTCDEIPGCGPGTADADDTDDETDETGADDTDDGTDEAGPDDTEPDPDDTAAAGETGDTTPDDTAPIGGERARGLVLFGVNFETELFTLWIHDADDTLVHELSFGEADSDRTYAMAWDDAQGRFFVGFNNQISVLELPKKSDDLEIDVGDAIRELKVVGGAVWVIGEETLGVIEGGGVGAPAYTLVADGVFTELSGGYFAESTRTIEVVDLDRGSPDLWSLDVTSLKLNRVASDIDSQDIRAKLPFGGRDDLPWSCTAAGAVYDLVALQGGNREPERSAELPTADVIDCDYDAGSDEVLMFSTDAGALRVNAAGDVDRFSLPDGYILLAGAVW